MAGDKDSEYEPLLANSEAFERAKRTASKKRLLLVFGLVVVVTVLVIAITVPLVTSNNTPNDNLKERNEVDELRFFSTDWNNDNTKCVRPPIPFNYNSKELLGTWYEVAKIQTPAVAVFQEGCSCSTMTLEAPSESVPQTLMKMECRDARIGGSECGAIATMSEQNRRGHWIQNLYGEDVNWYVILQTSSLLLTYDCNISYEDEVEYGIHLYSLTRRPKAEMIENKLDTIMQYIGGILNPQNISTVMIKQGDCNYPILEENNDNDIYDDYKEYSNIGLLDLGTDFLYQ